MLQGLAKAKANQAVRIARGPDGTRGFTAALQPGGRARLLPPPAPIPPETAAVAPGSAGAGCLPHLPALFASCCAIGFSLTHAHRINVAFPARIYPLYPRSGLACTSVSIHSVKFSVNTSTQTFMGSDNSWAVT